MKHFTRWMIAAFALVSGGSPLAAAGAPPLSVEGLAQAVECRVSPTAYASYADGLFNDTPPGWATLERHNGHEGMAGLWTYRLPRPVTIFGHSVDRISLLNTWVVIELPRAQALALIREKGMTRVPVRTDEQYYHAIDPDHGPALGAFPDVDKAMRQMAGGTFPQDDANTTLFVGCDYLDVSEADFVRAALGVEAMLIKEMKLK